MHAGVPQVCNAYPEYLKINVQFPLALLIESPTATLIAEAVNNFKGCYIGKTTSRRRACSTRGVQLARGRKEAGADL
jgi:hypothetical protein